MSTEKMREEFEEAFLAKFGWRPSRMHGSDDYVEASANLAWWFWQASRAALVVELPETSLTGSIGVAHKAVTKRCREAIEAAGVRVRP